MTDLFTEINERQKHVLSNPGLHPGLSEIDYHGLPALSNSMLSRFKKTPATMMEPQPVTPSLHFGRAFHALVLEPERFPNDYIVRPAEYQGNKKEWKEWKALQELEGRAILTPDEYIHLQGMRASALAHPLADRMLGLDRNPVELTATWRFGGTMCKARFDILNDQEGAIVDLKTAADASPYAFRRDLFKYGYHRQGGWYLDGLANADPEREWDCFYFYAVEKTPPYNVCVYGIEEVLHMGREQYQDLFGRYEECADKNEFPAYYSDRVWHVEMDF